MCGYARILVGVHVVYVADAVGYEDLGMEGERFVPNSGRQWNARAGGELLTGRWLWRGWMIDEESAARRRASGGNIPYHSRRGESLPSGSTARHFVVNALEFGVEGRQ